MDGKADPFDVDGWDWPFIIYAGTVWLRRKEEDVWKMTPRKFKALLDVHNDLQRIQNGKKSLRKVKEELTFIDLIPGW